MCVLYNLYTEGFLNPIFFFFRIIIHTMCLAAPFFVEIALVAEHAPPHIPFSFLLKYRLIFFFFFSFPKTRPSTSYVQQTRPYFSCFFFFQIAGEGGYTAPVSIRSVGFFYPYYFIMGARILEHNN